MDMDQTRVAVEDTIAEMRPLNSFNVFLKGFFEKSSGADTGQKLELGPVNFDFR